MGVVQQAFNAFHGTDLYTVVLPFILIFAIVFGLLSKLALFGDKSKPANAIIGLVIAVYAASNPAVTGFAPQLTEVFGSTGLILIFVLTALIGAALFGVTPNGESRGFQVLAGLMALGLLGIVAINGGLDAALPATTVPGAAITIPAVDLMTTAIVLTMVGGVAYVVRA